MLARVVLLYHELKLHVQRKRFSNLKQQLAIFLYLPYLNIFLALRLVSKLLVSILFIFCLATSFEQDFNIFVHCIYIIFDSIIEIFLLVEKCVKVLLTVKVFLI